MNEIEIVSQTKNCDEQQSVEEKKSSAQQGVGVKDLTFEQKKEIARKMMSVSEQNKNNNQRYFDFYDDVKDRTRGHEDW